jgi:nitrite reductase/ring-hydroxylating ferredoxin subunit
MSANDAERRTAWREEFPIREDDERYVTRRQFARFLVLTSLAMFIGNVWILAKSWLAKAPRFVDTTIPGAAGLPVGGSTVFDYPEPGEPCLVIRVSQDEFVAFSQKCTHLSCAVYYSKEDDRIECPCHNGYFSSRDGRVLQGPPPRPLPRVLLERRGGELVAVGMTTGSEG